MPLIELTNRLLPAAMLFRDWGLSVTEGIANLESAKDRADFVQELLVKRLQEDTPACPAVDAPSRLLMQRAGLDPIPELERRLGYSQRYLEMLFKKHVDSQRPSQAFFAFKIYRKWARGPSYDQLKQEIYSYYYNHGTFTRYPKEQVLPPQRFVGRLRTHLEDI